MGWAQNFQILNEPNTNKSDDKFKSTNTKRREKLPDKLLECPWGGHTYWGVCWVCLMQLGAGAGPTI